MSTSTISELVFIYSPNIGLYACLLSSFSSSVDSKVYGLVWGSFLRIEILDERRVSVYVGPCGVPVDESFGLTQ